MPIKCVNCPFVCDTSRGMSAHRARFCQVAEKKKKHLRVKRRRHPGEPVNVVRHSVVGHANQEKRDLAKKQDRAVTYTAHCVWKPPTLAEAADMV